MENSKLKKALTIFTLVIALILIISFGVAVFGGNSKSNTELSYSRYNIKNGGFETGDLSGWKLTNSQLGAVSNVKKYWVGDAEKADGYDFGLDGDFMFSAYATSVESAVGILTSSSFVIGGSGFITYKLGAAPNIFLDVVEESTGDILGRYRNSLWSERANSTKSGCTLIPYKADLSAFLGKKVYLRIVDNQESNYGLFFLDSVCTFNLKEPDSSYHLAADFLHSYYYTPNIYSVTNSGFETGSLIGWSRNGDFGRVTSADRFFSGETYDKDGNYFFSGIEDYQAGNGLEVNKGTLTSSPFVLGGIKHISYKMGGGNNDCYLEIFDFHTGAIVARFRRDRSFSNEHGGKMFSYVADLSSVESGSVLCARLVDNADSNWGCVSFDSLVTYYTSVSQLNNLGNYTIAQSDTIL